MNEGKKMKTDYKQSIRKEGLYRIKLPNGDWTIAEWVDNGASSGWYLPGVEDPADEEGFEHIGSMVIFLCGWKSLTSTDLPYKIGCCGEVTRERYNFCPHCGGRIVWK